MLRLILRNIFIGIYMVKKLLFVKGTNCNLRFTSRYLPILKIHRAILVAQAAPYTPYKGILILLNIKIMSTKAKESIKNDL